MLYLEYVWASKRDHKTGVADLKLWSQRKYSPKMSSMGKFSSLRIFIHVNSMPHFMTKHQPLFQWINTLQLYSCMLHLRLFFNRPFFFCKKQIPHETPRGQPTKGKYFMATSFMPHLKVRCQQPGSCKSCSKVLRIAANAP